MWSSMRTRFDVYAILSKYNLQPLAVTKLEVFRNFWQILGTVLWKA